MKTSSLQISLLVFILLIIQNNAAAQNAPVTTSTTFANAIAGTITIPVTVTNFSNIGAISLSLDYDNSVMHFIQGTPNPLLPTFLVGDNDLGTGYHRLLMAWYGGGTTLTDGSTIMTLNFNYISGITTLTWYDNGPSCEYADADYNVMNDIPTGDYYINGYVCGLIGDPGPVIGNDSVCRGRAGEVYGIDPVINATGYNWSVPSGATIVTGQGTNSITVDYSDDAVSGIISVYGINQCGNGPSAELAVTVNELPVSFAGNDTIIPYGTSTTLHAATGGTGIFAYHWSPEGLLIDPDVQNPQTVILTLTTMFTVVVTNQSTLCQSNDEMTVAISGGPLSVNPIAIPAAICLGENAQLFSGAGGGSGNYNYMWTCIPPGSPPWSSTEANPVVSPDSSKHYLLSVFDGFITVSGSTNLLVYQLPTAIISGGDTLCGSGNTANLTVDLTGVPPWSFIYSNGITSVNVYNQYTTPYTIITGDPGTYTIIDVEDFHCAGISYGSATVNVFPVPATPEISIYEIVLISSICCGNQWYLNDTAIPGATEQTYHATVSGLYYVIVTLNGCSSEPSEVVDLVVGIDELSTVILSFYPNPAKSLVNIQTSRPITGDLKVFLCSAGGIMIKEYYFKEERTSYFIDTGFLAPGLYFLKFSVEDIYSVGKLIIR